MNLQWILVALFVGVSGLYLLRRAWKTWTARSGCGGGCGCASTSKTEPQETFVPLGELRLRSQKSIDKK